VLFGAIYFEYLEVLSTDSLQTSGLLIKIQIFWFKVGGGLLVSRTD